MRSILKAVMVMLVGFTLFTDGNKMERTSLHLNDVIPKMDLEQIYKDKPDKVICNCCGCELENLKVRRVSLHCKECGGTSLFYSGV